MFTITTALVDDYIRKREENQRGGPEPSCPAVLAWEHQLTLAKENGDLRSYTGEDREGLTLFTARISGAWLGAYQELWVAVPTSHGAGSSYIAMIAGEARYVRTRRHQAVVYTPSIPLHMYVAPLGPEEDYSELFETTLRQFRPDDSRPFDPDPAVWTSMYQRIPRRPFIRLLEPPGEPPYEYGEWGTFGRSESAR